MTPAAFDPAIVADRLSTIRQLLDHLATLLPVRTADLRADLTLRLAVERILTQLVDLAASANTHIATHTLGRRITTLGDSFTALADHGVLDEDLAAHLRKAVGLRNILVHEYLRGRADRPAVARAARRPAPRQPADVSGKSGEYARFVATSRSLSADAAKTDFEIVAAATGPAIDDFGAYARAVAAFLSSGDADR